MLAQCPLGYQSPSDRKILIVRLLSGQAEHPSGEPAQNKSNFLRVVDDGCGDTACQQVRYSGLPNPEGTIEQDEHTRSLSDAARRRATLSRYRRQSAVFGGGSRRTAAPKSGTRSGIVSPGPPIGPCWPAALRDACGVGALPLDDATQFEIQDPLGL